MQRRNTIREWAALWLAASWLATALAAAPGCVAASADGSTVPQSPTLAVRRGRFVQRLLLSGEVDARSSAELSIPRIPSNRVSIRWLAEDGSAVKAGDKVVELDNTQFSGDVRERKLAHLQAQVDLAYQESESANQIADKEFDVERKRTGVVKARIEASVSADVVTRREYLEKQVALARAEAELVKAEEALATQRKTSDLDVGVKRIALGKTQREIDVAEKAINALVLTAPRDGIVLIGEHFEEQRKLQVGDELWMGFKVARLPDLDSMEVRATLSDVDDGKVTAGMPAVSTLDAYSELRFTGKVTALTPVARAASRQSLRRSFVATVSLDQADPRRMRPGMSVKVEVTRRLMERALLVPRAALDFGRPAPRARLADGGEKDVRLGPCNALECVVEHGLAEGARLR